MTDKIDYKINLNPLYTASKDPTFVEVPNLNFLMIDGQGDPNVSLEYKEAVSALYSLAYALKFYIKKSFGIDCGVMPLEGLWWVEDMSTFSIEAKGLWQWTMMILQPEWIGADIAARLQEETYHKKKLEALKKVRFESYTEGTAFQLMHNGPFAEEGPDMACMHAYAHEKGFQPAGKHHEIYLSDYTRTAPEKLKTILRQPVKKI